MQLGDAMICGDHAACAVGRMSEAAQVWRVMGSYSIDGV